MRVLFVCTGNTCRSLMAQHLLEKMLEAKNLQGWEVRSCGIAAEESFPVPLHVKELLSKEGVPNIRHTPKRLDREILTWADLVLTMSPMHQDALRLYYAESLAKTKLLTSYAGLEEPEVPDPIGQSREVYVQCLELLRKALTKMMEKHAPAS